MKSSGTRGRTPRGVGPPRKAPARGHASRADRESRRAQGRVAEVGVKGQSPVWLPALLTLIFAGFILLPRVDANPHLQASFLVAAAFLLAGLCALWWRVVRTGRTLTYEFVPRRVHWVQMIMHSCVYAYWGWYWREVYHEVPLIVAGVHQHRSEEHTSELQSPDHLVCRLLLE